MRSYLKIFFLSFLTLPSFSNTYQIEKVISGFSYPIYLTSAKDGSKRLFIVEQPGTIKVFKNGVITSFFNIQEHVKWGGEMGLLGFAFHPQFTSNGKFYVNYTHASKTLVTRISEFQTGHLEPKGQGISSEKILLEFVQPYPNHNGGHIEFGPDGFLYIAVGDGGSASDPHNHGQTLSTLLGSILRIDVNAKTYAIPKDNPFIHHKNTKPEIWAYGLRNPWRFSFDPKAHILIAADVGQEEWEEIDIIEKGGNYGWRIMEGNHCYIPKSCSMKDLKPPLYEYSHKEGISITGGYVYRGKKWKDLYGKYIYGDYGSGKIWALKFKNNKVIKNKLLLDTSLNISSFGIDEDQELYIVDHLGGAIYKLIHK